VQASPPRGLSQTDCPESSWKVTSTSHILRYADESNITSIDLYWYATLPGLPPFLISQGASVLPSFSNPGAYIPFTRSYPFVNFKLSTHHSSSLYQRYMKNNMVQQAFNTIWIHTQRLQRDDWRMQKNLERTNISRHVFWRIYLRSSQGLYVALLSSYNCHGSSMDDSPRKKYLY